MTGHATVYDYSDEWANAIRGYQVSLRVAGRPETTHQTIRFTAKSGEDLLSSIEPVPGDLSGLDTEARRKVDFAAQSAAMQADFKRRDDDRQQRLDSALSEVAKPSNRSPDEIREMQERLRREQ